MPTALYVKQETAYLHMASRPLYPRNVAEPQNSRMEDKGSEIYQFFIVKLGVNLCCFFCHWFLNNIPADEPDGEAGKEHANIRYKHADPVASVGSF